MKELKLNVFGIVIGWDGKDRKGASISSSMKEDDPACYAFNAAVDGLESMILAHFCAGMDVTEPAYLEGVVTAYEAIGNNDDGFPAKQVIQQLNESGKMITFTDDAVVNMGDIFWCVEDFDSDGVPPRDTAQKCVETAIISTLEYLGESTAP